MANNGTNVGSVYFDVNLEDKSFRRNVQKQAGFLESTFGNSFGKIGKLAAVAFSVKAIGNFAKESIKLGSDLAEVQNVVDVTFGKNAQAINNFAKSSITSFGLAEKDTKRYAGTFGAMLKSMGVLPEQTKDMSIAMTGLAGDIASFYNLDTDEAFNKIKSGLAGEVEPLRQLGVNLSVANMEAYALTKGIKTNYQAMTEQQRALLRYNYLMSVTTDAQGDFIRTSDQWANQVRVLRVQWDSFKASLGQSFILVLKPIIAWLNLLVTKLITAANVFNQFMQGLTGRKNDSQLASMNAIAGSAGTATGAMDDLGDATKKAGKKAQNALMGFDEVNVLMDQTADSADNAGVGVAGAGSILPVDDGSGGALDLLSNKAKEMGQKVRDAFSWMKDGIIANKDIILPALGAIAGAMTAVFLYNGLPKLVGNMIGLFKTFGLAVQGALAFMMANPVLILVAVLGALVGALVTAYLTNDEFKARIDALWTTIKDYLTPVFETLKATVQDIWETVFVPFGNFLLWFWQSIIVPLGNIMIDGLGKSFQLVGQMAQSIWKNVLIPLGTFFITVFKASVQGLIDIFKYWWSVLTGLVSFLSSVFKPVMDLLVKAFEFLWYNVMSPFIDWLGGAFIQVFNRDMEMIKGVIGGLQNVFVGIINFITGVFTNNWGRAWDGVKQVFKGIFESLYAIAKTPLNLIVQAVNKVIDGLNKIQIKIPDWVSKVTGISGTWGFAIPKIPELAQGGIVDQPTLAMIGEKGKEAVVPLENTSFIDKLATALAGVLMTALQAGNTQSSSEVMDAIVNIDGAQLARILIPKIDKELQRMGYRTILQS